MRVRVRRGLRVAVAVAIAMTFVLGLATRGGARTADVTANVSIGDAAAAVTEGQQASFPVTFDQSATADFRVPYTTSEGLSGFFDVHTGDPTATTISVPTASNSVPEDNRTFTVTLQTPVDIPDDASSDATTAAIGTATGTGTIIDDDWQIGGITTTPSPPSVPENSGQTIDFQVSLNAAAPANHAITVDYAVADGSAQNGRDYTVTSPANGSTSGTLTFAPGSSSVDVQVKAKGDGLFGTDRAFTVTFANPQGAGFAGGVPNEQATGAITETDPPPLMGISTCTGSPVNGGSVASFPILLGGTHPATTLPASVDYTTVDDSTVGGDYEPVSGTAVIPVGQREFDLQVQTDVHPPAGDRTFHIQLSNPQNVRLGTSSASCTIHSTATSTGQPSIQIADPAPVAEPSSGSTPVTVQLTLTPPTPQPSNPGPVTVHWQTQDGTGPGAATAPTDYTAASGDVTWPGGTYGPNQSPITIAINANPARTTLGTFTVVFSSSDATFAGGSTATITIVPPGSTVPLLSIADASVAKHAGSVGVSVHMTPAAQGAVTVDYATADGTGANAAKAGTNYTAKNGTLTFAKGETAKTITIPILSNELVEPNRTFIVTLSNATGGGTITGGPATVTITNDVSIKIVPPVLKPKTTPIQKQPSALPSTQPTNTGKTHFVLVQMLTGTSKVDAKGRAPFKIGCPSIVVRSCTGTAVFDIGIKKKVGKKTVIRTMHVATGKFSVHSDKTGTLTVKLSAAGFKLLKTAKRMKVKVTLSSQDASGAKGVTAWLVTLQAPPPAKKAVAKKPVVKKK